MPNELSGSEHAEQDSPRALNAAAGLTGKFATCLQIGTFDLTREPAALAQQLKGEARAPSG